MKSKENVGKIHIKLFLTTNASVFKLQIIQDAQKSKHMTSLREFPIIKLKESASKQ